MIALALVLAAASAQAGEQKELHILSTNDMHAAIECMPRLGFVADSLRALYPDLLILSAGDNRSGEPLNDMYEIPAYPMVALMNIVGFHATTLGNHEFDSGQKGLSQLITMQNFPTLCANVHPASKWDMHIKPYQLYDCGGLTVGVIGAVALSPLGIPESHPNNTTDMKFDAPLEAIQEYRWLREKCDVVVFLSHLGYESDVEVSKSLPWVDIIVGGHSHTQLKGGEMHNGIFITQNMKSLPVATHTTLVLEGNKIVEKKAELIAIAGVNRVNKTLQELVRYFSENPAFKRVLAVAETPFTSREELGNMVVDAYRTEGKADVSFQNAGGVRMDYVPAGEMTVGDVLKMDPFQNALVEATITGKELAEMLISCYEHDKLRFPFVSGFKCDVTIDPNTQKITKLVLFDENGKKLNLKKTYRLVANSYAVAVSPTNRKDQGRNLTMTSPETIKNYLEHQGKVSYQGTSRVNMK